MKIKKEMINCLKENKEQYERTNKRLSHIYRNQISNKIDYGYLNRCLNEKETNLKKFNLISLRQEIINNQVDKNLIKIE